MAREDREENICIKPALRIRCQINQVAAYSRTDLSWWNVERGEKSSGPYGAAGDPLHFGACIPRVHDKEDQRRDNSGKPAASKELRQRRNKESGRQEYYTENDCKLRAPALDKPHMRHKQVDRSGDHRYGERKAVRISDTFES